MHIVRFTTDGDRVTIGVQDGAEVTELGHFRTLGELLARPLTEIRSLLTRPTGTRYAAADVRLLAPVDGLMEVWAAGVTYKRSRAARVAESERSASIYEQVYDAQRPELFFKSTAWRVVGHGGTVAIRGDSTVDVPEPELAMVLNSAGEIVGYTVCDDVSSRSIEGENPLYLPQAKVFLGGCALGPAIRPAWEIDDPYALPIEMRIDRDGAAAWQGAASTDQLNRRLTDLASWLLRADTYPEGVVLSTGTSLVPDLPFTLAPDDHIHITIPPIGTLSTSVRRS